MAHAGSCTDPMLDCRPIRESIDLCWIGWFGMRGFSNIALSLRDSGLSWKSTIGMANDAESTRFLDHSAIHGLSWGSTVGVADDAESTRFFDHSAVNGTAVLGGTLVCTLGWTNAISPLYLGADLCCIEWLTVIIALSLHDFGLGWRSAVGVTDNAEGAGFFDDGLAWRSTIGVTDDAEGADFFDHSAVYGLIRLDSSVAVSAGG